MEVDGLMKEQSSGTLAVLLFVGSDEPLPSTVFYQTSGDSMAVELCKLEANYFFRAPQWGRTKSLLRRTMHRICQVRPNYFEIRQCR